MSEDQQEGELQSQQQPEAARTGASGDKDSSEEGSSLQSTRQNSEVNNAATTPTTATATSNSNSSSSINSGAASESVLLMARLRAQVEFYFSPQNLSRDTYLRSILASYGNKVVPLSVICNFPKVRELCSGVVGSGGDPLSLIMRSVMGSSVVHVSPDGVWISPMLPLPPLDPVVYQRLLLQQQKQQQQQLHLHHRLIPTNTHPNMMGPRQMPLVLPQDSYNPTVQGLSANSSSTSSRQQQPQHVRSMTSSSPSLSSSQSQATPSGTATATATATAAEQPQKEQPQKEQPQKERTTVIVRDVPSDCPVDQMLKALTFHDDDDNDNLSTTKTPPPPTIIPKSARPDPTIPNIWYVTFASEEDALLAASRSHTRQIHGTPIRARIKTEPPTNTTTTTKITTNKPISNTPSKGAAASNDHLLQQTVLSSSSSRQSGSSISTSPTTTSSTLDPNSTKLSPSKEDYSSSSFSRQEQHGPFTIMQVPPTSTNTLSVTQLPPTRHHQNRLPAPPYPYHPTTAIYHLHGATTAQRAIPPPAQSYLHHPSLNIHHTTISQPQTPILQQQQQPQQQQLNQYLHYPQQQQYLHHHFHHPTTTTTTPAGSGFTYMNAAGHRNYFAPTTNNINNNALYLSNYDNNSFIHNQGSYLRKGYMGKNNNNEKKNTLDSTGKQNRRSNHSNKSFGFKKGAGGISHINNNKSSGDNNIEYNMNYNKSHKISGEDILGKASEDSLLRSGPPASSEKVHTDRMLSTGNSSQRYTHDSSSRAGNNHDGRGWTKQTPVSSKNKKKIKRRDEERRNSNYKGYSRDSAIYKKGGGNNNAEKQNLIFDNIDLLGGDHFPELTSKQESSNKKSSLAHNNNNVSTDAVCFSGYADVLRQTKTTATIPPKNVSSSSSGTNDDIVDVGINTPVEEKDAEETIQNARDDVSTLSQQLSQSHSVFEDISTIKEPSFEEPETIAVGALTGTKCSATSVINENSKDKTNSCINKNDDKKMANLSKKEKQNGSNSTVSQLTSIINQSEPTPQEACQELTKKTGKTYTAINSPKISPVEITMNHSLPSVWVNKLSFIDVVRKQS